MNTPKSTRSYKLLDWCEMDRLKNMLRSHQQYEPLQDGAEGYHHDENDEDSELQDADHAQPFSWVEYTVFLWLGVAMLWAWYGVLSSTTSA